MWIYKSFSTLELIGRILNGALVYYAIFSVYSTSDTSEFAGLIYAVLFIFICLHKVLLEIAFCIKAIIFSQCGIFASILECLLFSIAYCGIVFCIFFTLLRTQWNKQLIIPILLTIYLFCTTFFPFMRVFFYEGIWDTVLSIGILLLTPLCMGLVSSKLNNS